MRTMSICVAAKAAVLFAALALCVPAAGAEAEAPKAHRTDWLYEARWGVMYHYCNNWKNIHDSQQWSKTIDEFDAKGLAKQLKELGAGYFLITAKHCGAPIAPSAVYDAGEGVKVKSPKRDLIMDLADELAKHDIKLMLYLACGGADGAPGSAKVIEELSKRYGAKVKGWWIDNNPGDEKLQKLLADAARAGNPESLVAFSPPKGQQRNSPYEDYTAGNTHAPGIARCEGRFIQELQWHMLTYLGHNWGGYTKYEGKPRYDAGKAGGITQASISGGGVVTWDVPHKLNGLIHPDSMDVLKAIGQAGAQAKRETPESKGLPRVAAAKPHKTDWLYNARWGVFYDFTRFGNLKEEGWNDALKKFDVPGLLKQLKEVDAKYFMILAHSGGGLPAAPISGYKDGKFPARDLIGELADALGKKNIRLVLAYNCRGSAKATEAIEEMSKRYGKKVSGWWIDNTPSAESDQKLLADACHAGNADAIIAFNGGNPHHRYSAYQDFTGGRTSTPGQSICEKRFVADLQWHTLGMFGFSKYQVKYDAAKAAEITMRHVAGGGVITWNTPFTASGLIEPEWYDVVKAVGQAAGGAKREVVTAEVEVPVAQIPTPPKDAITTTLKHIDARCISAKQDWWPERQQELGLVTSVGQRHAQFARSYLQFDLSDIDRSKPLHSAVLYLYCKGGPIGDPVCQRNQLVVSRFLRQIAERDQRWYNNPFAPEGEQLVYLTKEGMYEINVTEIVKAWLSGEANYGFRLSAPGLGAQWQRYTITWKSYESKPYDPAENPNGPRLVIHQLPK